MTTATHADHDTAPTRKSETTARPLRLLLSGLGVVVVAWLIINIFLALAYYPGWFAGGNRILMAAVGVITGIGGAALLFYCVNLFVESLPRRLSQGVIPYAFLLPAFGFIGLMLIYPTVQTVNYSFANADSTKYVGLANYRYIFSDPSFWLSLTNNALWLLVVPAATVAIGVVVALFSDRLPAGGEKIAKSFIFLPQAISFVGASTIWGTLVYAADGDIGLLNAIVTAFGGEAQDWIRVDTARLNSFLLMVILIWLQVGFAMVLLSSAIKGVPEDTLEAARIDGAGERRIFFSIIVPQIKGTVITVFITVTIMVLKVFDIVYVLTNGQSRTNVIALRFFQEIFTSAQAGRGSAIVVVLLVLIIPVLIYQIRHYRKEQSA